MFLLCVCVCVCVCTQAGEDRTGELSGSYYMQYLNMTMAQALYVCWPLSSVRFHLFFRDLLPFIPPLPSASSALVSQIDNHIEKRDIHFASANGVYWYCLYLREALGYSLTCDPNEPTSLA